MSEFETSPAPEASGEEIVVVAGPVPDEPAQENVVAQGEVVSPDVPEPAVNPAVAPDVDFGGVAVEEGQPYFPKKFPAHLYEAIKAGEVFISRDVLEKIDERRSQEDLKVLIPACFKLLDELGL